MVWAACQGQRGEKKEAEAECVGVVGCSCPEAANISTRITC